MNKYDQFYPPIEPTEELVGQDISSYGLTFKELIRYRLTGQLPERVVVDNQRAARDQMIAAERLETKVEEKKVHYEGSVSEDMRECFKRVLAYWQEKELGKEDLIQSLNFIAEHIWQLTTQMSEDAEFVSTVKDNASLVITEVLNKYQQTTSLEIKSLMIHTLYHMADLPFDYEVDITDQDVYQLVDKDNFLQMMVIANPRISFASEWSIFELEKKYLMES